MISIYKHGIILQKSTLDFENAGVLNPAVIVFQNRIHLFYRAVRNGNHSTIGYCTLDTPLTVSSRREEPILFPEYEYECQGVEDPRIVRIDDLFYLTYTAYNGINAMGALATSSDLLSWHKRGIIVPQLPYGEFSHLAESSGPLNVKYMRYNEYGRHVVDEFSKNWVWDKNVLFFPRRINGKLAMLHRIKPDIQIVTDIEKTDELTPTYWTQYLQHFPKHIVMAPKYAHETSYIGGGCPPIETKEGWLIIYHGVCDSVSGFIYSACAALLDLEHPEFEIARLPYPLFTPEMSWEVNGEVNNVCFPSGAMVKDNLLYIYYGAADECIACASIELNHLLIELKKNLIVSEKSN